MNPMREALKRKKDGALSPHAAMGVDGHESEEMAHEDKEDSLLHQLMQLQSQEHSLHDDDGDKEDGAKFSDIAPSIKDRGTHEPDDKYVDHESGDKAPSSMPHKMAQDTGAQDAIVHGDEAVRQAMLKSHEGLKGLGSKAYAVMLKKKV